MEEPVGEWGFKALKQMIKLYFRQVRLLRSCVGSPIWVL